MASLKSTLEQSPFHGYSVVDYDNVTVLQVDGSSKEKNLPVTEQHDACSEPSVVEKTPVINGDISLNAEATAKTCEAVLGVLERYHLPCKSDAPASWPAKAVFSVQIERYVLKNEPIRMALPAFPFKSQNKKVKVLGRLPDKGEEVALAHLEGLCCAIEDVYIPGAIISIVSDGLMYNGRLRDLWFLSGKDEWLTNLLDILDVSDQEVWVYGQTLRQLCQDLNCRHLAFARLHNLTDEDDIPEPASE